MERSSKLPQLLDSGKVIFNQILNDTICEFWIITKSRPSVPSLELAKEHNFTFMAKPCFVSRRQLSNSSGSESVGSVAVATLHNLSLKNPSSYEHGLGMFIKDHVSQMSSLTT